MFLSVFGTPNNLEFVVFVKIHNLFSLALLIMFELLKVDISTYKPCHSNF